MTSHSSKRILPKPQQRGAALIVSLVVLLVLSLLGVSSMQGTILEERMAGNMYDRNLAFQAAEAALRAGENDVADGFGDPAEMATWYDATSNAAPAGLDDDANWPDGAFEYADALAGLSQAPEYIIEVQRTLPPLEADAPVELPLVRVSARGTGRNGTSVVVLQSIYKP